MTTSAKRDTLNLRIKPEERSLIDRAAKAKGKSRTAFILDAVRASAEEVLLDQTFILADPDAYKAFVERLDRPAQPNERLRKTLQTKPPWEEQ
ncbi:DUF1778 domain-containing protein [Microbulbifer sp.]|uniref:type II toxin-antitoxin system TacA family antitoxin n=1 Tax=Microbulbifer sp. TaxID=1908541 RepID=UPI003F398DDC